MTLLHHTTNNQQISAFERFYLGIRSIESKKQYPNRLQKFLDFLEIDKGSTIEERCQKCYNIIKAKTSEEIEDLLLKFIIFQNKRIERKEIGPGTLINYMKAVKLFFKMNRINIMWDIVRTIIPSEPTASDDRIPTISEIRKLVEYPDRRIKTIVLVMLSSGIRLGAWDYLKWKHLIPIYNNNNNNNDNNNFIAAKIIVYAGQDEEYFSFITPEAYHSLKEWMDFRASYGENITPESWLMRNTWKKVNVTQGSRRAGLAKKPIKFKSSGIRILMGRAWNIQNVRGILEEGEKRHEFKSTHGFRKFFKSNCEQTMKSLHVEMIMGHNTGLARNYYRPNENEILNEYYKAIPYLTINDEYRLSKQVQELKQKDDYQKYVIDKKMKEKDEEIANMRQAMRTVSESVNKMKNDFIVLQREKLERNKEIKDDFSKIRDDFRRIKSNLSTREILTQILEKVDQKREEVFAKKGLVTKEDEEAIKNSILEDIKQNDPNLAEFILTR